MSSPQEPHEGDVWADVVAEDAAEQRRRAREEREERQARAERERRAREQRERAERQERDRARAAGGRAESAPGAESEPEPEPDAGARSQSGDASDPLSRLLGGDAFGAELGPLVDEVRKLAFSVTDRLQQAQRASRAASSAAEGIEQLTAPLRERHPEVYRHLAAAGGELLAAYRAAVSGHERRWSGGQGNTPGEHIDLD